MFETLTVAYDPFEDRVILAIDIEKPEAASFWLTRRMALALVRQASELLDQTSPLAAAASYQDRQAVAAIEREVALGVTRNALSRTEDDLLNRAKTAAELAANIHVDVLAAALKVTITGLGGREVQGEMPRAMFQRILDLLMGEAAKGDWIGVPGPQTPAQTDVGPPSALN